jgi:hypothetical protein
LRLASTPDVDFDSNVLVDFEVNVDLNMASTVNPGGLSDPQSPGGSARRFGDPRGLSARGSTR